MSARDDLRRRLADQLANRDAVALALDRLPGRADLMMPEWTAEVWLRAIEETHVLVPRDRYERLRAYVVADQEFRQADTWAGIWQPDEVQRKAIELQYAGREKRRREAHQAITLGDLEPVVPAEAER